MSKKQDSEIGKDLPCLHCQLIEMGEMACYQGIAIARSILSVFSQYCLSILLALL